MRQIDLKLANYYI